jgi:hypothetical protein
MHKASQVGSGEIRRDVHSNNSYSKWKTFGFAILIIAGIGGLTVAGVGLGGLGAQQGWWQARMLSHLTHIHSIIMMAAGGSGGILSLIIGISGSANNKANIGKGLDGLLTKEASLNQKIKSTDHQSALEFARKMLEDHPEVKDSDFDWAQYAKQDIFSVDDKTPSNPEISRLLSIFKKIWLPKFDEAVKQGEGDPWADEERAKVADTCLKLSYAIVCLICDDMPDMQRKLPKHHADGFTFACRYSYQCKWVILHSKVYQNVRNASKWNQKHSQHFYQEGTIQSQWRKMFNHHCDYVQQCGWNLGDYRYDLWFKNDTPEECFPELDETFEPSQ